MVPTSNLGAGSPKAIWSDRHQGQTSYLSNLGPQIPHASQITKGKWRAQHLGSSHSKVWKHFFQIEQMKNKCEINYCSFLELRFTCRVNMPPTEHHPVTEHPSCADQRWWMNALIFKSILTRCPVLKTVLSLFTFYSLTLDFSAWFWVWESTLSKQLCAVLRVAKYIFKKMSHCYV